MKFLPVLILCASLVACGARSSDDEKVRELIAEAEKAAEARDVGDVVALLSPDYVDSQGNTRESLPLYLRAYFATHPKLELLVDVGSVDLPVPGLAKARVTVRGLDLGRFDVGEAVTLDVELRKDGEAWRVARADRVRD